MKENIFIYTFELKVDLMDLFLDIYISFLQFNSQVRAKELKLCMPEVFQG